MMGKQFSKIQLFLHLTEKHTELKMLPPKGEEDAPLLSVVTRQESLETLQLIQNRKLWRRVSSIKSPITLLTFSVAVIVGTVLELTRDKDF